jgi:hypothetical protein
MNQKHFDKLKEGVEAWNKWREENPGIKPDLSSANLRSKKLAWANLKGTNLEEADLRGANLREADLRGAELAMAKLGGAIFLRSNLEGAKLHHASLKETKFRHVNLKGGVLWKADLREAALLKTNLEGTDLSQADMRDAYVEGLKYKKLGLCRGIQLNGCHGSPRFIRDAKDNEFIEEFKDNHRAWHFIWWLFADFGRSMLRWIGWSLFLAIYFGTNFFLMGPDSFVVVHQSDKLPFDLITMLYYSVVTFTTLGFGDIKPLAQGAALWVMAEVIVGYIMLGGLVSIFATKLARRSA